MRKPKILGSLVAGGLLAVALFVGVGPEAVTGVEVEGEARRFRAEFIHDDKAGTTIGTFFCMPEDAKLISAVMRAHRQHGHSVQVRMLPRSECF